MSTLDKLASIACPVCRALAVLQELHDQQRTLQSSPAHVALYSQGYPLFYGQAHRALELIALDATAFCRRHRGGGRDRAGLQKLFTARRTELDELERAARTQAADAVTAAESRRSS